MVPVCNLCIEGEHARHPLMEPQEYVTHLKETLSLELGELRIMVIPCFVEFFNSEQNIPSEIKLQLNEVRSELHIQHQKLATQLDRILEEKLKVVDEIESQAETRIKNDQIAQGNLSTLIVISELYGDQLSSADALAFLNFMRERAPIEDLMVIPESQTPIPPTFIPGKADKETLMQQFGVLKVNEDRDQQKRRAQKCILAEPYLVDTFEVDINGKLYGIECVGKDKVWVRGDSNVVKLIDKDGYVCEEIVVGDGECEPNDLALTSEGDIAIANWDKTRIEKISSDKIPVQMLCVADWIPHGLCFADDNTYYITVQRGWEAKVIRVKGTSEEDIQYDETGRQFFRFPWEIGLNKKTADICVCDTGKNMLIALTQAGKKRFYYDGPFVSFHPRDVCSDDKGQILVSDLDNNCIHVIDHKGRFLAHLNTRADDLVLPFSICIDTDRNLWIGERDTKKIKIIKYRI